MRVPHSKIYELIKVHENERLTKRQLASSIDVSAHLIDVVLKEYGVEFNFITGNEARRINTEITIREKYGTKENFESHRKQRMQEACIEKYGVTHNSKVPDIVAKRVSTFHSKSDEEKEAIVETRNNSIIDKFGSAEKFKEHQQRKSEQTKLERYGDAHYNNKEKSRETCISKYGVDNPFKSDDVKSKIRETNQQRYGSQVYTQSSDYKSKTQQTCQSKYGCTSYLASEVGKEKIMSTNIDRYGVPFYVLTDDCIASRSTRDSKPNREFAVLLDNSCINYEREFRVENYIYDFKVENTLVEIDPYPTHNMDWNIFGSKGVDVDYHQSKTNVAIRNGYRCLHVWDWDDKSKVISLLKEKHRVYARECSVKEVSNKDANEFLIEHHIQSGCRGQDICLGLFYDSRLVQIITFGKPRYNSNYEWELLRLCTHSEYIIVGGASKLFKHFCTKLSPKSIISYCDTSKFTGDIYSTLGFEKGPSSRPSIHWFDGKIHITDNLLRQRGFDQLLGDRYGTFGKGSSNEELMLQHGFVRISDCGQQAYIWR